MPSVSNLTLISLILHIPWVKNLDIPHMIESLFFLFIRFISRIFLLSCFVSASVCPPVIIFLTRERDLSVRCLICLNPIGLNPVKLFAKLPKLNPQILSVTDFDALQGNGLIIIFLIIFL